MGLRSQLVAKYISWIALKSILARLSTNRKTVLYHFLASVYRCLFHTFLNRPYEKERQSNTITSPSPIFVVTSTWKERKCVILHHVYLTWIGINFILTFFHLSFQSSKLDVLPTVDCRSCANCRPFLFSGTTFTFCEQRLFMSFRPTWFRTNKYCFRKPIYLRNGNVSFLGRNRITKTFRWILCSESLSGTSATDLGSFVGSSNF